MLGNLQIYRKESEPRDKKSFLWIHSGENGNTVAQVYIGSRWVTLADSAIDEKRIAAIEKAVEANAAKIAENAEAISENSSAIKANSDAISQINETLDGLEELLAAI